MRIPSLEPARRASLGRDTLLLSLLTALLVGGGIAWLALRGNLVAWPAVLVAGLVCWLGVVGSLVVTAVGSRAGNSVGAILGGMLVRFGLPLGVGIGLTQSQHWLGQQGVFGFILVNYLTLLPIETWLSLPYGQQAKQQAAGKEI